MSFGRHRAEDRKRPTPVPVAPARAVILTGDCADDKLARERRQQIAAAFAWDDPGSAN